MAGIWKEPERTVVSGGVEEPEQLASEAEGTARTGDAVSTAGVIRACGAAGVQGDGHRPEG